MTELIYYIYLAYTIKLLSACIILFGLISFGYMAMLGEFKYIKPISIILLVCVVLLTLIPNKETMYMLVASYTGHDINMLIQLEEMFEYEHCN